MLKEGTIITLDDNQEYSVNLVEVINNNEYTLLSNMKNKEDIIICKVTKEKEGIMINSIENDEIVNISSILLEKLKKQLIMK